MRNLLMTALSLLFCATFLIACGDKSLPVVQYQVVKHEVPEQLLDCGTEPRAPAATKQSQVAGYIVDLRGWGQGCHDDLAQVKSVVMQ